MSHGTLRPVAIVEAILGSTLVGVCVVVAVVVGVFDGVRVGRGLSSSLPHPTRATAPIAAKPVSRVRRSMERSCPPQL